MHFDASGRVLKSLDFPDETLKLEITPCRGVPAMPIRFRCVYCDTLLGIARRKSGTVVKCPSCAGQLIVPSPEVDDDEAGPDAPTASSDDMGGTRRTATQLERTEKAAPVQTRDPQATVGEAGMLFERSDFDELLKPAIERKPAAAVKTNPARRSSAAVAPAPATAPAPFDFSQPVAAAAPPVQAQPLPSPRSGLVLTPLKLVFLMLLVLVGIGLAFTGGLLLGWYLHK
jgi:hypothetical protein